MAIFAPSISIGKRGKSAPAPFASAYISRTAQRLEATGEKRDYSRVHEREVLVHDFGVQGPADMPARFSERSALWNAAEEAERRSDANVYRRIMIPLPEGLGHDELKAISQSIIKERVGDGHVVDAVIHMNRDGSNPHLHIIEAMRPVDRDGFRAKSENVYLVRDRAGAEANLTASELKAEREQGREWEKVYRYAVGNEKRELTPTEAASWEGCKRIGRAPVQDTRYVVDWFDPDRAEVWREQWAARINEGLERAGRTDLVDHRSYKRQGLDVLPQRHEGPRVRAMEERAERAALDRGEEYVPVTDIRRGNIEANRINEQMREVVREIADTERERALAEREREAAQERVAVLERERGAAQERVAVLEREVRDAGQGVRGREVALGVARERNRELEKERGREEGRERQVGSVLEGRKKEAREVGRAREEVGERNRGLEAIRDQLRCRVEELRRQVDRARARLHGIAERQREQWRERFDRVRGGYAPERGMEGPEVGRDR